MRLAGRDSIKKLKFSCSWNICGTGFKLDFHMFQSRYVTSKFIKLDNVGHMKYNYIKKVKVTVASIQRKRSSTFAEVKIFIQVCTGHNEATHLSKQQIIIQE